MTRLIRRAVLAMVAASAGIVLHGQTTTADNALFDLSGLTAAGGRPTRRAHRRSSATSSACPRPSRCRRSRCRCRCSQRCRCRRFRCSQRSRCSQAIGRRQYRRAPIPTSACRSHRSSIPSSANPYHPSRTHRSPIPTSANPCRRSLIPAPANPCQRSPTPPSPDPDIRAPHRSRTAGGPPSGGWAGRIRRACAVIGRHDGRRRAATAGTGRRRDHTTPGRSNRGTGATIAAGEATASALPGGPPPAAAVTAASDALERPRPSDPTVELAADDTVASGGGVDAEVEGAVAETWAPSGGRGRGLPFTALGAVLAALGALWIVIAVVRRAIHRRGQWADEPGDLGREPDRVSADTRPSSAGTKPGVAGALRPIRREGPVRSRGSADSPAHPAGTSIGCRRTPGRCGRPLVGGCRGPLRRGLHARTPVNQLGRRVSHDLLVSRSGRQTSVPG